MNTELSPEITRTCSKGHGKIANNNSFRLNRNNIRLQCLELYNNMLQELNMALMQNAPKHQANTSKH